MAPEHLVIRLGGESGENVISGGEVLAQALARAGYSILTYTTFPAEIKGGACLFQVRVGSTPVTARGDALDALVAFNQEALDLGGGLLAPGGVVVYDSGACRAPDREGVAALGLPAGALARQVAPGGRAPKNMVLLGALAGVLGLDPRVLADLGLRVKWGGKPWLDASLRALAAGQEYALAHLPPVPVRRLPPPGDPGERLIISGNQCCILGALAAGMTFFAGYPITPASAIMEGLQDLAPTFGATCIQTEDEIAALAAVVGAGYAGARAMTATSGPGLSLMTELVGLAAMAEVPCVIVDVQRGGPATGLPTKQEQGDLNHAVYGGHGEAPRVVLAPTCVADCFYLTQQAFNLAERYQVPVLLLSDNTLAYRTETIPALDPARVPRYERPAPPDLGAGYRRYTSTVGVAPRSIPGEAGGRHVATGLEHGPSGRPDYSPANRREQVARRFGKLEGIHAHAWPPVQAGDPAAPVALVTWGSTTGIVLEAMGELARRGLRTRLLAPRLLHPLPAGDLRRWVAGARRVVVCEQNFTGQLAGLLAAQAGIAPVDRLTGSDGVPFQVAEIVDRVAALAGPGLAAGPGPGLATDPR